MDIAEQTIDWKGIPRLIIQSSYVVERKLGKRRRIEITCDPRATPLLTPKVINRITSHFYGLGWDTVSINGIRSSRQSEHK